jgi:hypothetical protein
VDFETGMGYATNAGNLRLELADFLEGRSKSSPKAKETRATELELEP